MGIVLNYIHFRFNSNAVFVENGLLYFTRKNQNILPGSRTVIHQYQSLIFVNAGIAFAKSFVTGLFD